MHTCRLIAFILLAAASLLAAVGKQWPLALIAAGLGVELIPAVF